MSDKRKLSTILGLCGATVLAGGGSAFLTDTGLSLVDNSQQIVRETEDPGTLTGETEQPLSVEQFSSTKDSFVISAREVLAKAQGEDGKSALGTGSSDSTMYATSQVNIRSSADADSEILGTLEDGEGVTITGNTSEGWVEISYNGQTGYVNGNYLTGGSGSSGGSSSGGSSGGSSSGGSSSGSAGDSYSGGSSGGSSTGGSSGGGSSDGGSAGGSYNGGSIATSGTMYATSGVNVRSGPGSDYRVLGTIEAGEGIGVTGGESGGWIEVSYNGQLGYIYNTYLVWDPNDISSGGSSGNSEAWDDSYYFYDVNSRYISADELDGWTATDLAYLRNEIFARHGRIFTTQKYIDYFSQKTWYNPTYDASYFDSNLDSFLNDYEWANLKIIQRLEDERS